MVAADLPARRRSRMHCDCATWWGGPAVISSMQCGVNRPRVNWRSMRWRGSGSEIKARSARSRERREINERNRAGHARSTSAVWMCGRVENATRLMADRSDAILKLAAAVPMMVNASPVPFIFGFNLVDRVAPAMAAQPTRTPFHSAPQRTTCGTGQRLTEETWLYRRDTSSIVARDGPPLPGSSP